MNASCHRPQHKHAFTLIEVLLVLVILGVMVTVMLPQVMSSLREHELRSATRVVMSSGRHAMSLAVLSQRQMSVVYDLENTTLTIKAATRLKRPDEVSEEAEDVSPDPVDPLAAFAEEAWQTDDGGGETRASDGAYDGAVAIVDEEVVHEFNGITFSFIEVEGEDGYRSQDGTHTIIYYTNGRCTPHTIGIEDGDGATATIEIDALSSGRVLKD
ncbi:MAG: prepilin-type N-terminal cleavage/methylation domain-containing protein [Kiritimatiellia bacterium]|nr:prepilin-type N-terminal cleavage/methylation domain-containing protein [Pseudomonadales bacterium]MDP6630364.1 prepilin-type N-terminal cleavage/methylation domain-containing protein [Kiritimatiellia bacterium]MDP6810870.1 prepilin-type N-terminal cleavage/methylation domain-containing protein [Kiritimatiellia bacterium]MDP7024213.1 prepilin-type N-terminal cleavage/methylation domain-containing protein [Kiritimatiellia bacterium]